MLNNYKSLYEYFGLKNKKQFFKLGFSHLKKYSDESVGSFFSMLIKNNIYQKNDIITVMGYLTKSKVLWDKRYDNGVYVGYDIKKGYGIGDYWKEYFRGIKYLKRNSLSDITLFRLNKSNSPYNNDLHLVEVMYFMKRYDKQRSLKENTILYIDYAILIKNSKEQIPIEELK